MLKRVLVTGANGQLGQSIKEVANNTSDIEFFYTNSNALDITNEKKVNSFFCKNKFDYCINCAAYTAVDKAEEERELAYEINVLGAKNLAEACKITNTILIHISTDFVFDGEKKQPYIESDIPNPKSVYGNTKLAGEEEIENILEKYFIIRTSWLYSIYGKNFMKTMLRLGEERSEISVVSDQIGTPTSAIDLANILLKLISKNNKEYGLYHFSNEGQTSWAGFAEEIFKLKSIICHVKSILTIEYPTLAVRPSYSVLRKEKISKALNISVLNWKDSLKTTLTAFGEK